LLEPIEEQKLVVPNFSACRSKIERNDCGQDGSILIAASVFLLVGVILLGSIQVGYMYYTKRELQKTADLAALTGVQSLWQGPDAAKTAAEKVAAQNFGGASVDAEPGNWTDGKFDSSLSPQNALQVVVSAPLSPIVPFFGMGSISAQAQAVTDPSASFSIGARALRVSDGLINLLLTTAGLDPNSLTVLDSAGLANLDVTPSGLLSALGLPASVVAGVGTPQQLADLQNLTLGHLLSATATLVGQGDDLSTAISLLNSSTLASNHVNLFGEGGILALPQADLTSALNTDISVGTLIKTALVVASTAHAIQLTVPNTPGLSALLSGPVQLMIVNPPTIAIGGEKTKAENAQVQVSIPLNVGLKVLGISLLNLPISLNLDAVKSVGILNDMCSPPMKNNEARIGVTSTLADISVSILGVPVSLPVGASDVSTVDMFAPEQQEVSQPTLGVNTLVTALINGVLGQGLSSLLSKAVLQPLLQPLDDLLTNVLELLGLDTNQTDITLYSVQCASPHLVQ
jgi:uncharacterized membrane protein